MIIGRVDYLVTVILERKVSEEENKMKKVLAVLLVLVMVLGLAACGKKEEPKTYQFGLGVSNEVSATSATAEKAGTAEADPTYAIILVDKDGKIVKCEFDVAQERASVDAAGAITYTDAPTKREKGYDYGMTKASPIGKDWFEQADHLAAQIIGLTKDEAIAKIAVDPETNKSTNADVLAGCTIGHMNSFVEALVNAFDHLEDAGEATDIQLGVAISNTPKDAESFQFNIYVGASAIDANGKLTAVQIDCSQLTFTLDDKGTITAPTDLRSKFNKGFDYGMTKASPIGKDWFEQSEHLGEYLEGKTVEEIKGISLDEGGKATDADILAGCTMGHLGDLIGSVVNGWK